MTFKSWISSTWNNFWDVSEFKEPGRKFLPTLSNPPFHPRLSRWIGKEVEFAKTGLNKDHQKEIYRGRILKISNDIATVNVYSKSELYTKTWFSNPDRSWTSAQWQNRKHHKFRYCVPAQDKNWRPIDNMSMLIRYSKGKWKYYNE
jgi:hypothetical protein